MNLGRGRGVAEPTPGSLWYSITARKFSEGVLGSVRSYLECMKSILLLPLLISPNPSDPSATVSLVLDEFHRAAGMADSDQYFGMMAEDGVFIGTDADERWSVAEFRDYAEPYFSRGTGWTYVASDRNIKLSGSEDVAWFDERLQNVKYGSRVGLERFTPHDLAHDLLRGSRSPAVSIEHNSTHLIRVLGGEETGNLSSPAWMVTRSWNTRACVGAYPCAPRTWVRTVRWDSSS